MIKVQTIVNQCSAQLDAELSGRYIFDLDYKPAINYSVQWIVSLFNSVFGQKKFSEENLRELVKVKSFLTSSYSRLSWDDDLLWSVLAVYINPTYSGSLPSQPDLTKSVKTNVVFIDSDQAAKRITQEELAEIKHNPFTAGSNFTDNDEIRQYGYLWTNNQVLIQPDYKNKVVSVSYLEQPTEITAITDSVPLPPALTTMLVDGALRFIAVKQGDATNLYGVSKDFENQLIQLMT